MANRILIVDDCPDVLMLNRKVLELAHFDVLEARSGKAAQSLLQERDDIDLLITDLQMPGMSGIELIAWCRQQRKKLPCMVVSAHITASAQAALDALGVKDCLHKPVFPISLLVGRVAEILACRSQKPLVLVADDSVEFKDFVKTALPSGVFVVTGVSSLRSLESVLGQITPQVILLDSLGDQAANESVCRRFGERMPIISCSGTPVIERRSLLEAGARSLLEKPLQVDELRQAISETVEESCKSSL